MYRFAAHQKQVEDRPQIESIYGKFQLSQMFVLEMVQSERYELRQDII